MPELGDDILRFLQSAHDGVSADGTLEEQASYRLAMAAIEDAEMLDEQILRGFAVFTAFAHHNPEFAQEMIDDPSVAEE